MKIIAIRRRRGQPELLNVYLSNGKRCSLPAAMVDEAGWRTGTELGEADLTSYIEMGDAARAKEYSLRLLGHRGRSTGELRDRLARKGFSAAVSNQCLAQLTSAGLLDDEAYARTFVAERVRRKPQGIAGIVADLRSRRIPAELAAAAVSEVFAADEITEGELARRALRKFRARKAEDPRAARRRLQRFLAAKGFSSETIFEFSEEYATRPDDTEGNIGGSGS